MKTTMLTELQTLESSNLNLRVYESQEKFLRNPKS